MFNNIQERWVGAKIEFVPDGTDIGTVEDPSLVSATTKPATDMIWNAWHFGDVVSRKPDNKTKTVNREYFSRVAKKYIEREDVRVTQDRFVVTMKDFCSLHDQLSFGLASAPVNNTPQPTFATIDRSINGWVRLTRYNEDGVAISKTEFHGKVDLPEIPEDKNEFGSPTYRFQHLKDADPEMEETTMFPLAA